MTGGISVIVPFLNEADGIGAFCDTLDSYAKTLDFELELVFVDDGSTDNTCTILESYHFQEIKNIQLVILSKNVGSHGAIWAGLAYARFDICTWMGSDLQEPLEFLPLSYNRIIAGVEAVYVEKNTVATSFFERSFSKLFAALMRRFALKNFASGGVATIVFNGKIKEHLLLHVERNSAINLQIMDAGFKSSTISLDYHARTAGVSKWTLSKKLKLLIDSFVSFSFAPIRFVTIIGALMFVGGFILGAVIIINKFINLASPVPGYATLASLLSIGFGITNISLGIIAEYLWRTFDAARNRPLYIVSEHRVLRSC